MQTTEAISSELILDFLLLDILIITVLIFASIPVSYKLWVLYL